MTSYSIALLDAPNSMATQVEDINDNGLVLGEFFSRPE